MKSIPLRRLLKRISLLLSVILLCSLFVPAHGEATAQRYVYKEPYLRDAVQRSLYIQHGAAASFLNFDVDSIDTIRSLTVLNLSGLGLTQLPDLSDFTSLKRLGLQNNPIEDVSALVNYPGLTFLNLDSTRVKSVPFLPNLTCLRISKSDVEELPVLPTGIVELVLSDTKISDISSLQSKQSLGWIELCNTSVTDFSPLMGVTSLEGLRIGNEGQPLTEDAIRLVAQQKSLRMLTLFGSEHFQTDYLLKLSSLESLSIVGPLQNQETATEDISKIHTLKMLGLKQSGITDIRFVENLSGLNGLALTESKIQDISPLANLKNLQDITLNGNEITDLSPLSGLGIRTLYAANNRISDITPLAKLTALQAVDLSGNQITDVSPLTGLLLLQTVDLSGNHITDVSTLSALSLTSAIFMDNPIENNAKAREAIPGILLGSKEDYDRRNKPFRFEDERVQAAFEKSLRESHSNLYQGGETTYQLAQACTSLDLVDLGLTELPDLSAFKNLRTLFLNGNEITDISQVEGLSLQAFTCDSSAVTDWSPLYSQTELVSLGFGGKGYTFAQADMDLVASNPKLLTLQLTGTGTLDIAPISTLRNLENLLVIIDGPLDFSALKGMKKLNLVSVEILDSTTLAGLDALGSVKNAVISSQGTNPVDLTAFSGIKKMETLVIFDATIADFSPLQKAKALKHLTLRRTKFPNDQLVEIAKLKKLTALDIDSTPLADIAALAKIKNLSKLDIRNCGISDIAPLAGLTKLTELFLCHNGITDVTALAKLKKLAVLWLEDNLITDVQPLGKLTKLENIGLAHNRISDFSPLYTLKKLSKLSYGENPIADEGGLLHVLYFATAAAFDDLPAEE